MGATPKIFASLIGNAEDEVHRDEIRRRLAHAMHFVCIVAFAKTSGWNLIADAVAKRAAQGLEATFVIGLDFYQSDPRVLRAILRLRSKATASGGAISLYLGGPSRKTLHPKVYWFNGPGGQAMIIGSANMTSGGISTNHELSALLTGSAARQQAWLKQWIDDRIEAKDIVEATEARIKRYERCRNIHQAAMMIAERQAARAVKAEDGHIITLQALLVEMRADERDEGFDQSMALRRRNLPKARAQIAVLGRKPDLNRSAFLKAYEKLIGYWHSGGIARGKNLVAGRSARFQAALRALAAVRSDDPAVLFDLLRTHFEKIPRAGTNVITEILHARDPARFPVMNQNSVSGMRLANITGYPRAPSKTSVDGARYARFAADAERLRRSLGLADLSELDALFNYAYWNTGGADGDDE